MTTHGYSLQILKEGRVPVGRPVDLSLRGPLQRGVEALHWRSFVAGKPTMPDQIRINPRWSDLGEPVVADILIETGTDTIAMPATRLFAAAARRASSDLVESKLLAPGDPCHFLVTAQATTASAPPPVFHLDNYPLCERTPNTRGEAIDQEFTQPHDFPVHISPTVIADALRMAELAGDTETGGVLFGHLTRNNLDSGALLEVTHLCPAAEGRGDGTSFTFTPDTWSLAQATLTGRAAGEIMVGSYHSHPDFCKKCPPERQQSCAMRTPFFSEDDIKLHESVFPAAYSIGLLASHDGARFHPSLFGWRDGFISRRAYHTSH